MLRLKKLLCFEKLHLFYRFSRASFWPQPPRRLRPAQPACARKGARPKNGRAPDTAQHKRTKRKAPETEMVSSA
jgi:hypothetical protein